MKQTLILVIFWVIFESCTIWSLSINSMFTARNSKYREIGGDKNLMESIEYGTKMALEQCQSKFKWERWNCPENAFSSRTHHSMTREQSFISAIKSAAIVYSITRNCSRGELPGCRCDSSRSGKGGIHPISLNLTENSPNFINNNYNLTNVHWTWGGCSDNLEYGEQISKVILEEKETGKDWKALVEKHNIAAGRILVRSTMQKRCRCHGISGSCSMQTCWMQMASFDVIANELKKKYNIAKKLDRGQKFNSIGDFDKITDASQTDLVYLSESPNFCKMNTITGWNGTKGRACSRSKDQFASASERRSCKNLCRSCGHRVRRQRKRLARRCNCSFIWCCEVRCDTCYETVDEYFCE